MREMVTADASLFQSHSGLQRHAAMSVVNALLAAEDPRGYTQIPRVLAPEGEGGSAPGPPQRDKTSTPKFQIGASLQEQDQLKVLAMLDTNLDRFAFSLEDIEPFTREPLQIHLNSSQPIFRPPHKLG